jgi:16S rRNA (guanine(966)-N(2))-methyltransferase RsmD
MPYGSGIRPTSEKVRNAIFSILVSRGLGMDKVLDLYAGTGALGIEALSRGACHVDFVERNSRNSSVIKENLKTTGLLENGSVHTIDVLQALIRFSGPYDLVLMDPPYEDGSIGKSINLILEKDLIKPNGVLVVEHSKHMVLNMKYGTLVSILARSYGDTILSIFQQEGNL